MIDPNLPPHDWLRLYLERQTGNAGTERSDAAIDTRLRSTLASTNTPDVDSLVRALRIGAVDEALQTRVVAALLNNETSFFRDPHCFDGLRDHVLPELLRQRLPSRRLNVWSAACSSGQEPYSLAMLLRDSFPAETAQLRVEIHATDASAPMIERVAAGRYTTLELARGVSDECRRRWFTPDQSQWQIDRSLRAMVKPRVVNLVESWPPLPQMDLVMLRNVMIYMKPEVRQTLLKRIRKAMNPQGALVLGGPESLLESDFFERETHGRLRVYRPV